jgi:EAL domain-containing protein (putative c-di-GMP-specific phosphodiesterase class I)/ActR/RegA family two-component response regulator
MMNMHAAKAVTAAAPATPVRRSLLVIDDEEVQRMHVHSIARNLGFDVDEAESIGQALDCLAARDYDAVVVDLTLGDHDGVEVIRNIARSGKRPDVIVLSGHEDRVRNAVVRFGRATGLSVIGQFQKPLKAPEFRQCLTDATARAEREAERKIALDIPVADVRVAIANGEIVPVYQVQVSLETGAVVGVEALPRWRSPQHGSVPQDVIVEIAEKGGLAMALTRNMLTGVIADATPWCDRVQDFRVAVNVSAAVLSDLTFPDEVMAALKAGGMRPENLTIEVTETTALSDIVNNADVMSRLCIKGISLSLDDFGKGSGSLKTLTDLPFEEIKIDRAFVVEAYRDTNAWTIVQATIALAKARDMRIVAEGIESHVMLDLLRESGVDCGQGYLFGRPMAAAEIAGRLTGQIAAPGFE